MREVSYEGISQSPREFLKNRTLMSSLGKAEAEEVLHRILRFCLEKDCWVAPTDKELDAQVNADLALIREAGEIRERNWKKREAYEKASKWNWLRRLFGKEVTEPEYEEEKETPFTLLIMDPRALIKGIYHMQEREFLKIDKEGDERFFMATEKALQSMPIVRS